VVCGSILFGVAIIPVQAAKLVDIFVESQKDQQERRRKGPTTKSEVKVTSTSSTTNNATNGMGPSGTELEVPPKDRLGTESLGRRCGQCSAAPHRVDAVFCWSCGAEL